MQHIGSKTVHNRDITGKGISVAVIDSGIDYTHDDLKDNYQGGYDFINNDNYPMDDSNYPNHSHGTNVAGIIAAQKNDTGVVGVAPEVSLYALKVLNEQGSGDTSHVIAAIEWAVENGIDIINLSMEMNNAFLGNQEKQALQAACEAAYNAGVLIVAAAGNTFGQEVNYPAAFDSVIAVTATDRDNIPADFSPESIKIELSAPGKDIYSTARVSKGGYNTLSGTSQAAPHVTGVAALILSSGNLEDMNNDGEINNKDLRIKLQVSVNDLDRAGKDELFGYGLVNADEAVTPTNQIYIERTQQWLNGWKTHTVENGIHDISIQNHSLYGIISWVSENGLFRQDLSTVHIFESSQQQPLQQIDFSLDATGTSFKITFIPFGKIGSSAKIIITD